MTEGPLAGLLVADFSRVLAGPLATMTLGDLGADVVKVERPGSGDDTRSWSPPVAADGTATYFLAVNRNKRSVAIDLSTDEGRAPTFERYPHDDEPSLLHSLHWPVPGPRLHGRHAAPLSWMSCLLSVIHG